MKRPVLVIGDLIEDVYISGRVVGIANEDPVPKFRPNLRHRVVRGGVGFIVDSIHSFSGFKPELLITSKSSIIRYVDERYGRNTYTVDNVPQLNVWEPSDIYKALSCHPEIIVVWDDGRAPAVMEMVRHAIRKTQLTGKKNKQSTVIVDSADIKWNTTITSYWKMSSEEFYDYNLWSAPIATPYIITSSRQVVYRNSPVIERIKVPTVDDPVDTCGAGDVFLSVFVSLLHEGYDEISAIKEAIKYSVESVKHPGCFMPPRDTTLWKNQ